MPLEPEIRDKIKSAVTTMRQQGRSDNDIRTFLSGVKKKYGVDGGQDSIQEPSFPSPVQLNPQSLGQDTLSPQNVNPNVERNYMASQESFPRTSKLMGKIEEEKRKTFQEMPFMDRMLAGAGKTFYSTMVGIPKMAYGYMLDGTKGLIEAENEIKDLMGEYGTASRGDFASGLGEMGADISMFAVPGTNIAKSTKAIAHGTNFLNKLRKSSPALASMAESGMAGLTTGMASAGMHQVQNVGSAKETDLGDASIEIAISSILPFVGAGFAEKLKKLGPDVLHSVVKPLLNQMDSPNPPDFAKALEKKLVGYLGGLEKSQNIAGGKVSKLGDARAAILEGVSKKGSGEVRRAMNFTKGIIPNARNIIEKEFKDPKGKISKEQYQKALDALAYWKEQGVVRPTQKGGWMSPEDAVSFRQIIDDEIDWRKGQQAIEPGFEKASKQIRREIENYLQKVSPEAAELTKEMGGIYPYFKALKRRNLQAANNYIPSLTRLGALGAGGTVGGLIPVDGVGSDGERTSERGAYAVPGAVMGLAIAQLLTTPGGARILFDMGEKGLIDQGIWPQLRNTLMQTVRKSAND